MFSVVAPFQRALDFHLERHNLLASNVAHVDTPGFKPKDIERTSQASAAGEAFALALTRAHAGHMGPGGQAGVEGRVFDDLSAGGGADGNYVSLDREASKLGANQLRYDIISVLVSAELDGLRAAASDMKG